MSAKVICLASAKGGTGKTNITANIAKLLTGMGKKCLIFDCDIATHGMTLLYVVEVAEFSRSSEHPRIGLFDQLVPETTSNKLDVDVLTVENGVDMLPATYNFSTELNWQSKSDGRLLVNTVGAFRERYDFILLDAQAGSDKWSRNAISKDVSDEVIIVTEYDPLSSAGVERMKQVLGRILINHELGSL